MKIAALCVRDLPHYRGQAFKDGLIKTGFQIIREPEMTPSPKSLLIIWNRQGHFHNAARRYEAAGAAVIVAENGYIGHDDVGHHLFALSLNHHNGRGDFFQGDAVRPVPTLAPWRADGRHVLVLCQRGIGEPGVCMPRHWAVDVERRLRANTRRPIKIRQHPGRFNIPLEPDFVDCWAAVTWGSSAAIKALAAGIPVFHELKGWIGAGAASDRLAEMERPWMGDRQPMFNRLAWGQWTAEEISTGGPILLLLHHHFQGSRCHHMPHRDNVVPFPQPIS